jgi:hypothetical protein
MTDRFAAGNPTMALSPDINAHDTKRWHARCDESERGLASCRYLPAVCDLGVTRFHSVYETRGLRATVSGSLHALVT